MWIFKIGKKILLDKAMRMKHWERKEGHRLYLD